jgi:carbon storage regulator
MTNASGGGRQILPNPSVWWRFGVGGAYPSTNPRGNSPLVQQIIEEASGKPREAIQHSPYLGDLDSVYNSTIPNHGSQDFMIREKRNMLVLSRKRGEAINIGDGITITVLAMSGGRIKLGIVAPAEVPVNRQEVYQKIGDDSSVLRFAGCA